MSGNFRVLGLGLLAAALTSLSYIPQAAKAAPRGATKDLSLKMLIALFTGLLCWMVYGIAKGDWVIIVANCAGHCWSDLCFARFVTRNR